MQAYAATLKGLHARLSKMRRRGITAASALQLQAAVLRTILRYERRVRKLRELIASDRARLAGAGGVRLTKADAQIAKNRIQRRSNAVERLRRALTLTRSVTDGLVFCLLPKWDIKPLSFKESAGFVSGKIGLRQERRMLRALAAHGRIAIMNDLTNCLRYGDLTIPRHPVPVIIEVKSSDIDTPRIRRQLAEASEIADYLSRDVSVNWHGSGMTVVRAELLHAERNHRKRLVRLIEAARNVGHSISWPEPGLCYCCFGHSPVRRAFDSLRSRLKRPPLGFPLFPADSRPGYYYPLTLSIGNPEAWWSVVSGEISILVLVDPARVRALGRSMGLTFALVDEPPDWMWSITGADGDSPFKISAQLFGRIAHEFLSLEWFVKETAARFRKGPEAEGLGLE